MNERQEEGKQEHVNGNINRAAAMSRVPILRMIQFTDDDADDERSTACSLC